LLRVRDGFVTTPPRYAVFGQPIAHSLSPRIHAMFAAQFGIALDYRAIEAGHDDFARALDAFAREGGLGANVTLPLKQDALALCAGVSDRARRCGSVNTLIGDGERWRGDSTDGIGLLRDLQTRHAFEARGQRCLLLGAGGAARAVAFALADAGAAALVMANRTHERARQLATAIDATPRADAVHWDSLDEAGAFDLVLHATAAGHDSAPLSLPHSIVTRHALCYDLSYGNAAAPFVSWAKAAGAGRIADGLGMLVEQAAESFAIWHGRKPDAAPVFAELRREFPLATDGR
jgi:shikimate dehydrogenase